MHLPPGDGLPFRQHPPVPDRLARAALDALHQHVAVIDARGRLVEAGEGWRALDGGKGEQAIPIGGNYLQACEAGTRADRDAVRFAAGIRSVLRGEADRFEMEWATRQGDAPKWMHSKVRRFLVDDAVYAAIAHEDVTARHESDQELQALRTRQWHSERITQAGMLVGSLAHELCQPLTAILSNAQAGKRFIDSNALDPQDMRAILADIIADNKRAGEIIESLRVLLRRQKTGREAVELGNIVRDVFRLVHGEAACAQVEMEERCMPGCTAMVNRGQIQQVLLNLVMNAIQAMLPIDARTRRLSVAVSPSPGGAVRIAVHDCGIGIAAEQLESGFSPFHTTKTDGIGMGLTICHSIVESHGGRIWGERNADSGSTFFVELPASVGGVISKAASANTGDAGHASMGIRGAR